MALIKTFFFFGGGGGRWDFLQNYSNDHVLDFILMKKGQKEEKMSSACSALCMLK